MRKQDRDFILLAGVMVVGMAVCLVVIPSIPVHSQNTDAPGPGTDILGPFPASPPMTGWINTDTIGISKVTIAPPPTPVWVEDPSAGHYDCPEGWMEYEPAEPPVYRNGPQTLPYMSVPKDAKGHVLKFRPAPGICIEVKK